MVSGGVIKRVGDVHTKSRALDRAAAGVDKQHLKVRRCLMRCLSQTQNPEAVGRSHQIFVAIRVHQLLISNARLRQGVGAGAAQITGGAPAHHAGAAGSARVICSSLPNPVHVSGRQRVVDSVRLLGRLVAWLGTAALRVCAHPRHTANLALGPDGWFVSAAAAEEDVVAASIAADRACSSAK